MAHRRTAPRAPIPTEHPHQDVINAATKQIDLLERQRSLLANEGRVMQPLSTKAAEVVFVFCDGIKNMCDALLKQNLLLARTIEAEGQSLLIRFEIGQLFKEADAMHNAVPMIQGMARSLVESGIKRDEANQAAPVVPIATLDSHETVAFPIAPTRNTAARLDTSMSEAI